MNFLFVFNSILLGVGLAMDAFSVSMANGLNEPYMSRKKTLGIAGTFAFFQALMPMAGWICVHTVVTMFRWFERLIPWIALILLVYIGGNMIYEGIRAKDESYESGGLKAGELMVQGVATSIDALSVGFTIAHYNALEALLSSLLIGIVTFFICFMGLQIGKKAGTKLAGKAGIFGGAILIFIGIEIFVSSLL